MELSPDQQSCFDAIMSWYSDSGNFISLGGFSGTGKTTLISHLRKDVYKRQGLDYLYAQM